MERRFTLHHAMVIAGTEVSVIAADPFVFPFLDAGVHAFLGLLVAVGGLAGVLGFTRNLRSPHADAVCVTGIVVSAGIAVHAGIPFRENLRLALPSVCVAGFGDAIGQIGVFALLLLAAAARTQSTSLVGSARIAIVTWCRIGKVLARTPDFRVTPILRACVLVVAIEILATDTDSFGTALVTDSAFVAVIATGVLFDLVLADPTRRAKVAGARVGVLAVGMAEAAAGLPGVLAQAARPGTGVLGAQVSVVAVGCIRAAFLDDTYVVECKAGRLADTAAIDLK